MLAAAEGSHVQRWWKTMSAQHFYARPAVDLHTARLTWRTGTATGNRKEGQGGRACSGSPPSPGPASVERPPPAPTHA